MNDIVDLRVLGSSCCSWHCSCSRVRSRSSDAGGSVALVPLGTPPLAGQVHRLLEDSGTVLITRIAGLLLAAIAVQMVADSLRAFVSGTA